jgi:succinoglycan biosynthesis transport protein ExoP
MARREQSADDAFVVLRATVDSYTAMPAIILVTSALPGDGKSTVAFGLARAFADANVEVALVNGNADRPRKTAFNEKHVSSVSLPDQPGAITVHDEVTPPFLEHLRERFAVTIVDAGTIAERGMTLQVARIADAVVLAVRQGRRRTKEDDQGIAMLRRVGARLVGVVPVAGLEAAAQRQDALSNAQRFMSHRFSSLRTLLR